MQLFFRIVTTHCQSSIIIQCHSAYIHQEDHPVFATAEVAISSTPKLRSNQSCDHKQRHIMPSNIPTGTIELAVDAGSKVRNPPPIAPIPIRTPSQRLILRTSNLTRLRVLLALEFRLHANGRIRVRLGLGLGGRRLVDLGRAECAGGLSL